MTTEEPKQPTGSQQGVPALDSSDARLGPGLAVHMEGIAKRFKTVVANRAATLAVRAGEIHALVGENGAGKTTLMNILYGLYSPDEGRISINGRAVEKLSPTRAVELGIGMVHQHFMLIPTFTVLENIILGIEETRGAFLDTSRIEAHLARIEETYGLAVDLTARVGDLPVSLQQRVEILKVLVRGAKILVLDEPTAVLTPQEVLELFRILRTLRDQGATLILITHKLREVKALSDRLTVMREGTMVGTHVTAEVTEEKIAELMVGRPVRFAVNRREREPAEVRLKALGLSYREHGRQLLDGVDLAVRSGEVVGLAGVAGNGQTELVLGLVGLLEGLGGSVYLEGQDVSRRSIGERQEMGLRHIPEDRLKYAVVPDYTVAENMVLGLHHRAPFSWMGLVRPRPIQEMAMGLCTEYDVRPPEPELPLRVLSGGNQQKVVIARECAHQPRVLIASLPTRGVDIGAIEFIHERLMELKQRGVAILLVSSELSEILSLSDRIAVIYRGRILASYVAREATESKLGLAMAGVVSA